MQTTNSIPMWTGQAAIGFGIGAFLGQSGNNHTHRHYAHQITMSIDTHQYVKIICNRQLYEASILFIPANVPHQLLTGFYLSIYIDPCHSLATQLNQLLNTPTDIIEITDNLKQYLQENFNPNVSLHQGLTNFLQAVQLKEKPRLSDKIEQILILLYQGMLYSNIPDRQYLAHVAGLSESRFSHWFREQTGLPLRSYRKWLRLICGLMQIRKGQALTDIAYHVNFADQAHFTRTCIELFGVRPSELLEIEEKSFYSPYK